MFYLLVLGPFAFSYLMSFLLRAVNAIVGPDLVRDVGLNATELGLLTAAYLLAFAAFQIPLGVLLDRYGPRRVQATLLLLAGLGTYLFSLGDDMITLTLARALIGLGFAGGLMAGFKAVVQFVPPERRALANACVMAFGALGLLLAAQPTEFAVSAFGWRNVFVIYAGLIFISAALVFFVAKEGKSPAKTSTVSQQLRGAWTVYTSSVFWRIAPVGMLTAGAHLGFQTLWAGPWFRDVMGYDRNEVGGALSILAIAFLIGILFSGVLADWLGRKGIGLLTVTGGIQLIFIASEIPLMMNWTSVALPAWFVFGMTGQAVILAYSWFSSYFGSELSGRSNTAINLLIFVFGFVTQYLVGTIIDIYPPTASGGYAPEAYQVSFAVIIATQVIAFVWFLASLKTLRQARHAQS